MKKNKHIRLLLSIYLMIWAMFIWSLFCHNSLPAGTQKENATGFTDRKTKIGNKELSLGTNPMLWTRLTENLLFTHSTGRFSTEPQKENTPEIQQPKNWKDQFAVNNTPRWNATTPSFTWEASLGTGQFGYSTSSAGDVNGDGYDDIIAGAPFYGNRAGAAAVYYGGPSGISGSWFYAYPDNSCLFGFGVSKAGDVNKDGYDDVIIGAYGYTGIAPNFTFGKVFLFYGSAAGLSPTPGWTTETNQVGACYGQFVNTAGDVNGDGYDDVMIAAPVYNGVAGSDVGKVFVYYGSSTGPGTTANWTVEGDQSNCQLGYGMGPIGDVNKDGYDDIIVAASYYSNGELNEGRMYVYYGGPSGLAASPAWTTESNIRYGMLGRRKCIGGDVNGDGYDDVVVVTSEPGYASFTSYVYAYYSGPGGLSTTPNWIIASPPANGAFFDIAAMGDMNHDGYDDILVSQATYNSQGRACIYYGTRVGLSHQPGWTVSYTDPEPWYGPRFGLSVANAGDVNHDGKNDVLIGSADASNAGRIYLYLNPVITLPLKLLSFASVCTGNDMQLQWQTANELNSKEFSIERSNNGTSWQSVANIPAAGSATYNYNISSLTAVGYYRLKMIDIDGSYTYSAVLPVKNACRVNNNFSWTVTPNPVKSFGNLQLDLANYTGSTTPLKVKLTDMQGKMITLGSLNIPASIAYHTGFDLPALSAGVYIVNISNVNMRESKTIMVSK